MATREKGRGLREEKGVQAEGRYRRIERGETGKERIERGIERR